MTLTEKEQACKHSWEKVNEKNNDKRTCKLCNIEEWRTEKCLHCKFFIPNSIASPIPKAGLSDQGYCNKHRALFPESNAAYEKFIKFVSRWTDFFQFGGNDNPQLEKEREQKRIEKHNREFERKLALKNGEIKNAN